jgi:hypothetical protein
MHTDCWSATKLPVPSASLVVPPSVVCEVCARTRARSKVRRGPTTGGCSRTGWSGSFSKTLTFWKAIEPADKSSRLGILLMVQCGRFWKAGTNQRANWDGATLQPRFGDLNHRSPSVVRRQPLVVLLRLLCAPTSPDDAICVSAAAQLSLPETSKAERRDVI